MQEWLERRRALRGVATIVVLAIIAFTQSCSELKYRIWSVRAEAEVTDIMPSEREGCRFVKFWVRDQDSHWVRFNRTLDMTRRSLLVGSKVEVEYLPRQTEKARLLDERSLFWPSVLLTLIVLAGSWIAMAWHQFHRDIRRAGTPRR